MLGVGKSSILVRYVKNDFDVKGEQPTIGAGFLAKEETIGSETVRFHVMRGLQYLSLVDLGYRRPREVPRSGPNVLSR